MNSDAYLKILISTSSALIGWVLAQVTATIKPRLERRRIIRLLLEELRDLDREAGRLLFYHARNLQLYGANGIKHSAVVGLSNPIYSNYYKDALLSLNQNQRISFQMIHEMVYHQNEILKEIHTVNSSVYKEYMENGLSASIAKGGKHHGQLSKDGYSNCSIIKWHIKHHLERKSNPGLTPYSEDHKAYLQYLESLIKEIDKTIDSGRAIPKEKFGKLFDESDFGPSLQ